jgi:hypothetical protein
LLVHVEVLATGGLPSQPTGPRWIADASCTGGTQAKAWLERAPGGTRSGARTPCSRRGTRHAATEKIDHDEFGIALQVIGALILDHQVRLAPEEKQQMIALI